jgi:hypothetical protein
MSVRNQGAKPAMHIPWRLKSNFQPIESQNYLFIAGKIIIGSEKKHAMALLPTKQNHNKVKNNILDYSTLLD